MRASPSIVARSGAANSPPGCSAWSCSRPRNSAVMSCDTCSIGTSPARGVPSTLRATASSTSCIHGRKDRMSPSRSSGTSAAPAASWVSTLSPPAAISASCNLARDRDEISERVHRLELGGVARGASLAVRDRGRDEQFLDAAEVVEDQRLVEVARPGDRTSGCPDDAVVPQRFQRRRDDAGAGIGPALVRAR